MIMVQLPHLTMRLAIFFFFNEEILNALFN